MKQKNAVFVNDASASLDWPEA